MAFGLGKSEKQPEHEGDPEDSPGGTAAHTEDGDPSPADESPAVRQPHEESRDAMAFRPSFLDSDTPGERAPATQPPKGDAFFISVAKNGEAEIHRFDGPSQAQTFVEQLLEDGVPQEEVTAFSARQVTLRVTHRPIVTLVTSQDG